MEATEKMKDGEKYNQDDEKKLQCIVEDFGMFPSAGTYIDRYTNKRRYST